jgi:hypothetical protein
MSIRIDYGGVAIGAKEDFAAEITDKADFVDLSELQQDGFNFPNFGNPCELYSVVLDGSVSAFPSDTESANLGWWSEQISGEDGAFETPIVSTFEADELYTSSGITFTFDTYNSIYATEVNIKWYQGNTLLSDMDFYPDSPFYFCVNKVDFYNKLLITFKSINMPYNRLKLRAIEYGMRISFYGDELKDTKIIQEIDPLSTQISINTCDFILESKRNIDFSFQERQPINIYFNDKLRATSFVKAAKRKSKNTWSIQSEDYIGLMEDIPYQGGIYYNKNAVELLADIFETAKVPFDIDAKFDNVTVTGHIPYTNCRKALMQVAFAIQAAVDTSNSDLVNIFELNQKVSQIIPLNRIMQGQSFKDETRVTAVEITAHTFVKNTDSIEVYNSSNSGIGNEIMVVFNEPLHDLSIVNGEITSSGANYAVINAFAGCTLTGQKYNHIRTIKNKKNPLVLGTDTDNVISIGDARLVSNNNVDKILAKCYNYYANNSVINLNIVEGKHEAKSQYALYGQSLYGMVKYGGALKERTIVYDETSSVGDYIECQTEYLGNLTGRVTRQSYNLNGNIIIKDTQLKRDMIILLPYYSITNNLSACSTNNNDGIIESASAYTATITGIQHQGLLFGSESDYEVTMGGVDITNDVVFHDSFPCLTININIPNVTGDIYIYANPS